MGRSSINVALVVALSCLGVAGDGCSKPTEICQHPCDLMQTVYVEIAGSEPAATISASGACEAQITCPNQQSCARVQLNLKNSGPGFGGSGTADMVCHITAVSRSGVTVERDVSAHYTNSHCCSGWEFPFGGVKINFDQPDAAAGGDAAADHPDAAGGSDGATPMTPTEVCRAAYEALCSRASVCFGQTMEECTARAVYCPDYYFNADSNRTVAEVVACLPALRGVTCTDLYMGIYPPCIASGKQPLGIACSFPSQCESNTCSLVTPACESCGAGAATVGQSCATTACHGGATCDPQTKVCVDARKTIYVAEGQPCNAGLDPPVGCRGELICLTPTRDSSAGTCKKPPGPGEPCATASIFDTICARGSRCNGSPNGTCVPDDSCGTLTCAAGSTCQQGDGGFACVPRVVPRGVAESCDAQHGCAYGLACNAGGTCEVGPPKPCP